jgi:hypothetical protein
MPSLLANTVLTLLVGASQPVSQPSDAPNWAKLNDAERGIRQLDQKLQQMTSKLNQVPTEPFLFIDPSVPATIDIKPYGPSFMFNGVRVYIEQIGLASSAPPVSRSK